MNYGAHMMEYIIIKNHFNKILMTYAQLKEWIQDCLNTMIPVLKDIHTYYDIKVWREIHTNTRLFLEVVLHMIWAFF